MKSLNSRLTLLLPFLLLAIGLYLVPIRIFQPDFSKVPGDLGDARFNNYILEHGHKFLLGKVTSYWDAPFMYPQKNVIAFSDNLLGTLPVYSIFRILGNDRETSFQLWLLTLFALNFICCYWVLKRWSNNIALSATGAYVYAFSIFIIGHIYNVQSFPRFIVPFVFYWSWEYLSRKQLKHFLFIILGIVYQFYCGIYLGFMLIYTIMFLFIAYMVVYQDKFLFSQFKKIKITVYHLFAIILGGALLTPLMLPYIEVAKITGFRHFDQALSTIPLLRSYFFTSSAAVMWGCLSQHGFGMPEWWCHFLFIGGLPWLGIIALPVVLFSKKIAPVRKKFIAFISLGLFFSFIFCLNIHGFTLYRIIFNIPGFSSMRSINRVINTEVMYFILIFVFVFYELLKSFKIMKWVVMCFPILIIIDNLIDPQEVMRYDKKESQEQIKTVKEKIKSSYEKKYLAIAYMPEDIGEMPSYPHLNVMLAAQELNIPCVNAYTGSFPNRYIDFLNHADDDGLNRWCEFNNLDKSLIQKITIIDGQKVTIKKINLQAANGKFVCADKSINNLLIADRDSAFAWETFSLYVIDNNNCAIRAYDNNYICDEMNNLDRISASRKEAHSWETFSMILVDSNRVAFKAVNEKYLSMDEKSFLIFANGDTIGNKEKFLLINK